jgi:hypothetical protein
MISQDDLNNRFTYHPPKEEQIGQFESIRRTGGGFAQLINELVPDSREKSLAITAIEEAVMWANAGIARNS